MPGMHFHDEPNPLHSHSFVEIAFVAGGPGDAPVARPGRSRWRPATLCCCGRVSGTATTTATGLALYNCCFSAELLRRELAWTREDPLLGYLLWSGPYSASGHGMLATRLDDLARAECEEHLAALDSLRRQPGPSVPRRHRRPALADLRQPGPGGLAEPRDPA